ncbi:hypothetical protein LTR91_008070 [Friedmanniomyces endolithicus]|uniref:Uncharacterized protein n=1 Tax=Friedmanniomyces endolithicus TaxID=329885 RepID=A0AAN6KPR8_9PEZI|nr:hypothetical protein LTS09_003387 [Friedmanniomyces endolithicus]KAK0289012.1 hypothetical protein LTR35_003414 [Friedmanniomyces endolithicus]KAK0293209.1 hypothetical protein LTS00_007812 [Friedmanniomyces endolithicus]KAK0304875.1 hypothetical protein LTR01_007079 [Friedmanniomyces endolithicus]KAK0319543.1 hypothetical protein LTR82_009610 [Friedmanniomyces endolithicus]
MANRKTSLDGQRVFGASEGQLLLHGAEIGQRQGEAENGYENHNRSLRHWTIHRAWRLYQTKLRLSRQIELERQYNSMAAACEALRLIDGHGLTAEERSRVGDPDVSEGDKEVGRLYRIAMRKDDIWKGVPIEYARIQTDSPPRDGWNHAWTK